VAKKGDYPIPFTRNGDMLEYAGSWERDVVWKENFEFHATLRFLRFEKGRSAVRCIFGRVERGKVRGELTMFLTDLKTVLPRLVRGEFTGTFTFQKRGQNYGCRPILNCILECDSPSYPPEADEYRQCGCPDCLKRMGGDGD
jgi:hypothetical protein